MSEKDKVFSIFEGLKTSVKTKFYELRILDLSTTYATVERLFVLIIDKMEPDVHKWWK